MRFLLFFFILSLLIVVGCSSSSECKESLDCGTPRGCIESYSCLDGICNTNWKENCCGNNIPEEIEDGKIGNECTCPQDHGPCQISTEYNVEYFEAGCDDENICAVDVKSGIQKKEEVSVNLDLRDIKMIMKVSFDSPFDIKSSVFDVEFELTDIGTNIIEPKITKIQVESVENRKAISLGEKDINKKLWMVGSKINDEVFLRFEPKSPVEDLQINFQIGYEYIKEVSGRDNQIIRNTQKAEIKSSRDQLKLLYPTREYPCGDCDDGNPGTIGSCVEGTPFCEQVRRQGVCGNYVCEGIENKCNCPNDCGPCTGTYGNHLKFGCDLEEKCTTMLITQPKLSTFKKDQFTNYFTATAYAKLMQPFDVDVDMIEIIVQLIDTKSELKTPVKVEKIEITSGSQVIGSLVTTSSNELYKVYDEVSFDIPLDFIMSSLEEEMALTYTIYYSYQHEERVAGGGTQVSDIKRGTMAQQIDKSIFVEVGR